MSSAASHLLPINGTPGDQGAGVAPGGAVPQLELQALAMLPDALQQLKLTTKEDNLGVENTEKVMQANLQQLIEDTNRANKRGLHLQEEEEEEEEETNIKLEFAQGSMKEKLVEKKEALHTIPLALKEREERLEEKADLKRQMSPNGQICFKSLKRQRKWEALQRLKHMSKLKLRESVFSDIDKFVDYVEGLYLQKLASCCSTSIPTTHSTSVT